MGSHPPFLLRVFFFHQFLIATLFEMEHFDFCCYRILFFEDFSPLDWLFIGLTFQTFLFKMSSVSLFSGTQFFMSVSFSFFLFFIISKNVFFLQLWKFQYSKILCSKGIKILFVFVVRPSAAHFHCTALNIGFVWKPALSFCFSVCNFA